MQTLEGTTFDGRYAIIRQLGEGGMGAVYLALETELRRHVAIKILHNGLLVDEDQIARFEREARILSTLSHPNILTFYRFGVYQKSIPFLVMEYLQGQTLQRLLATNGRIDITTCVSMAMEVCSAIGYAHQQGIIHRDLTPANIFISEAPDGQHIKILDFGLASAVTNDSGGARLTQTGALIGSVFYMSPEQCTGRKADSRSDIYSLGCVMYQAISGSTPFEADNPIGLMHLHATSNVVALSKAFPDLCKQANDKTRLAAIDTILLKALAKSPDDRYQCIEELSRDLQVWRDGRFELIAASAFTGTKKRPSRKGRALFAGVAVCCMLFTGVLIAWSLRRSDVSDFYTPRRNSLHAQINAWAIQPHTKERFQTLLRIVREIEGGAYATTDEINKLYSNLVSETIEFGSLADSIQMLNNIIALTPKNEHNTHLLAILYTGRAMLHAHMSDGREAYADSLTALRLHERAASPLIERAEALRIYCKTIVMLDSNNPSNPVLNATSLKQLTKRIKACREDTLTGRRYFFYATLSPLLDYLYKKAGINREQSLFQQTLEAVSQLGILEQASCIGEWYDMFTLTNQTRQAELCFGAWLSFLEKHTKLNVNEAKEAAGRLLCGRRAFRLALPYLKETAKCDTKFSSEHDAALLLCKVVAKDNTDFTPLLDRVCEVQSPAKLCSLVPECIRTKNTQCLFRLLDAAERKFRTLTPHEFYEHYEGAMLGANSQLRIQLLSRLEKTLSNPPIDYYCLARAVFARAAALQGTQEFNKALLSYRSARTLFEKCENHDFIPLVDIRVAECYLQTGQKEKARNLTNETLRQNLPDKTSVDILTRGFEFYVLLDQDEDAAQCLKRIIKSGKRNLDSINAAAALVAFHFHQHRFNESRQVAAEFLPIPKHLPDDLVEPYISLEIQLGNCYLEEKRYIDSIPHFRKAVQLAEEYSFVESIGPKAELAAALSFLDQSDPNLHATVHKYLSEAKRAVGRSTRFETKMAIAVNEVAVLYQLGERKHALKLADEFMVLAHTNVAETNPLSFVKIANVYKTEGRTTDALHCVQLGLEACTLRATLNSPAARILQEQESKLKASL